MPTILCANLQFGARLRLGRVRQDRLEVMHRSLAPPCRVGVLHHGRWQELDCAEESACVGLVLAQAEIFKVPLIRSDAEENGLALGQFPKKTSNERERVLATDEQIKIKPLINPLAHTLTHTEAL